MTNTKATKRALLASIMAMLLCCSMLVGTTFAWFTDSVTSGSNMIQSGTLKIDLVDADGNSLEGEMIEWVATDGRTQDEILWEPGCTYETEEFYIVNNGNLNLKFQFNVTGIDGDAKLLEVVDFTCMADASWFNFNTGAVSVDGVSGEFDLLKGYELDTIFYGTQTFTEYVLEPGQKVGPIVLKGHMDENAGNDYQGLKIEGIAVSLIATQATGEEDSISGVYDENAEYPAVVFTADALKTALTAGKDVILGSDIIVNGNISLKSGATLYGNGNSLTGAQLYVGNGSTVKDVEFVGTAAEKGSQIYAHDVSVVIDGCTFDSAKWDAIQYTTNTANVTLTVNNCTFKSSNNPAYRYIHVELLNDSTDKPLRDQADNGVKVVMTNNTFENVDTCKDDAIGIYGVSKENVTTSGNTASAETDEKALAKCWFGVHTSGTWETYVYNPFDTIARPAANVNDLNTALEDGGNALLTTDVDTTTNASGYGMADINVNGGTLDGNGKTVSVDGNGDYTAISTNGGTIQNLAIDNGFRGIFLKDLTADVYLDDLKLGGDGVCYTINTGAGTENYSMYVTNCEINGWTSFNLKSASFENCTFGQGTYYTNVSGRLLKPYVNTTVTDCSFIEGFYLDLSALVEGHKVTLSGCTVDGNALTADICTTSGSEDGVTFYVELPAGRTLADCVIFK